MRISKMSIAAIKTMMKMNMDMKNKNTKNNNNFTLRTNRIHKNTITKSIFNMNVHKFTRLEISTYNNKESNKIPLITIIKTSSNNHYKKHINNTYLCINLYHHQKTINKRSTNSSIQSRRLWVLAIPYLYFRWSIILKKY